MRAMYGAHIPTTCMPRASNARPCGYPLKTPLSKGHQTNYKYLPSKTDILTIKREGDHSIVDKIASPKHDHHRGLPI